MLSPLEFFLESRSIGLILKCKFVCLTETANVGRCNFHTDSSRLGDIVTNKPHRVSERLDDNKRKHLNIPE